MVVVRAGRVHLYPRLQPQRAHLVAHDAIGGGAAADIAHADEEDAVGGHIHQYGKQILVQVFALYEFLFDIAVVIFQHR